MKLKKMNESIDVVRGINEMDKIIDNYVHDRTVKSQLKSASNRIKNAVKSNVIEVAGAMFDFTFNNAILIDEDELFYKKLEQITLNDIARICNIGRTTAYRYRKSKSMPTKFKILVKEEIEKQKL